MAAALPYHEPGIISILVISSFLLLLNAINFVLDHAIYCGLLGQILVGAAWGSPGGKLLDVGLENSIAQLGYLGLILVVYEGGVSTSFSAVKANLRISISVAITGICLPVAFSFSLRTIANATPLQAFAAGAALCSTSVGTTFTVLSTTDLTTTRMGTVLTTTAMLDVVGLIMVQVISNLGGMSSSSRSVTVIRPVFVSFGLVVVLLVFCRFLIKPLTLWMNEKRLKHPEGFLQKYLKWRETALMVHTSVLIVMVAGATYAGTSNLFAAYLAGASISWWDTEVPHPAPHSVAIIKQSGHDSITQQHIIAFARDQTVNTERFMGNADLSSVSIYNHCYAPAVEKILKPLFFASIGFSIPITQMFHASTVWRGIVYTILMSLGKFLTGLWLVRSSTPTLTFPAFSNISWLIWCRCSPRTSKPVKRDSIPKTCTSVSTVNDASHTREADGTTIASRPQMIEEETLSPAGPLVGRRTRKPKVLSLYPASIIGAAMVSRGEIGFLIASVADSSGIFTNNSSSVAIDGSGHGGSGDDGSGDSDLFLIVIWAITLCTIIGPVTVGILVRRVRSLQCKEQTRPAGRDPLGVWGIT